ncbi:uncharacterized protein [Littorina saxatilis]|uniref:uncharacterized protein n=1 Tax=Littorina saxatilis TaxID=31220 RepID=UPI0038B5BA1A
MLYVQIPIRRLKTKMAAKVIFFAALVVFASCQKLRPETNFQQIDLNGDGALSVTELATYCRELDTNGDGTVNFKEYTRGDAIQAAADEFKVQFAYYDSISGVKDDKVVCADDAFTFFGKLDANSNGKVAAEEFTKGAEMMTQEAKTLYSNSPDVGK